MVKLNVFEFKKKNSHKPAWGLRHPASIFSIFFNPKTPSSPSSLYLLSTFSLPLICLLSKRPEPGAAPTPAAAAHPAELGLRQTHQPRTRSASSLRPSTLASSPPGQFDSGDRPLCTQKTPPRATPTPAILICLGISRFFVFVSLSLILQLEP